MYSPLLEASVAPYRGRLSKEDVEEISQEALLSFHRAVKTFDPLYGDTGFGLYAKTCVANGVRDALRRIARGARLSTVPLEDTLPAGLGDDPAGSYIAEESAAELRARIRGALSPFENTVWWSHYSGMSCAEIAAASGRSVKSVNNALCRVRQKLRRLLS
jgi:RNA polymerase sporulation-specific sigma factor